MDALASTAEAVASSAGRLRKLAVLAGYFRTLDDEDLARAVRFLSGRPFAASDPRKLSAGYSTLRAAVTAVCGWDDETLSLCYREVGDAGEAIGLLVTGHAENRPLSLAEAEQFYCGLHAARRADDKIRILTEVFRSRRPPAIKYFVKVITGDLRIGLQEKLVEEALAAATGAPLAAIREANNRSGDLGLVAAAARRGTLDAIEAVLFHPMDFMLAKPLDSLEDLTDPENWIVEDKYDGIRAQVHASGGKVRIFTRGLEEATQSFPEVVTGLAWLGGSVVLDGEILAWRDGRALPFNILQQRIARKKVSAALLNQVPVAFLAYDILYRDGRLLVDVPVEERRRLLESLGVSPVAPQFSVASREEVDRFFEQARARGNEGLVLKRRGSVSESGRRSGAWQKVKRPYATLDVVVTGAEQGHGRRASVLSDYTFAVRDGERFLNVGKAYTGLTDAEILELTRLLRASTTERYGNVFLVRPEIVLEVAFDGIQKSPRHKSGYALRFPRIVRWRHDKKPEECDTLDRVRELYEASLAIPAP